MNKCLTFITIGLFYLLYPIASLAINPDDFLPPAQTDTPEAQQQATQIQQPEAVKEEKGLDEKPAISAANAQDAINTAIKNISVGGGCEEIKFPSGFGFVASGNATYGLVQNPTANLIAQRQAYQIAYLNAKKNLTEYLHGLSTEGQEQLQQEFNTLNIDTDSLANTSEKLSENIVELVKGLIRGYVVYSIDDNQGGQTGTVTVTIVSTPKTLGKSNRVNASSLTADNIRDGLAGVLSELSNGLLSPVGGKVINVPQTGELAFIGFGSAVVQSNPNKAVEAKLMLNAQKIAQMRARSALCGIILGDEIEGSSSLDAQTQSISKQFEEAQKDDPTVANQDKSAVTKLQDQVNSFVSTQLTKEQISSLRNGVLPPGVNVKTYMNPEKTLAEAVAVYLPSVTSRASKAAEDMKSAQILQNHSNSSGSATGSSAQTQESPKMPSRGASGQITNPNDL